MEAVMEKLQIQKYPAYKVSGFEWLGEIPVHWDLLRFKYLFTEINERSYDGSEDLLSVSQYTGVTLKRDNVEDGALLTNAETLEGYKKVSKRDLVSNIMLAWNGSLGFSEFDGITSPAYCVYRLLCNNNYRYFHYLLRSELYKSEFKRNSSGVIESRLRLYSDDFFKISSVLPSINEQTAIANFLDQKTAQIDKAIAQKEKLIELLKERRQILIHKAVTRGLDPNVRMKDSGVEWIGKIPEHWNVMKITYSVSLLVDGTHFSPKSFNEGDYKYVTAKNIKENGFDFSDLSYISEKDHRIIYKRCPVRKGDVLYIKDGATAGIATINTLDEEFSLLSSVALIRTKETLLKPSFLKHYLNSDVIKAFMNTQIVGGAMTRLTIELIKEYKMVVPPIEEQGQIASYINALSEKTYEGINLKENEVEKLKEYKGTLINAAVTGKIKVHHVTK
jgi:type I restriction enzyme, S subunit